MDPHSLEQYYHSVAINSSSLFGNMLSIQRFEAKSEWTALGKPVDKDKWYKMLNPFAVTQNANIRIGI